MESSRSKFACLWLSLLFLAVTKAQRIAVIGGGISGAFAAKYLADYNADACKLEGITIFDPVAVAETVTLDQNPDDDWQGSRISSLRLNDGSILELGASVLFKGFHLVVDMMRGDTDLKVGPPFDRGDDVEDPDLRKGMGVYNGDGEWSLLTTSAPGFLNKLSVLYRYNFDLLKLSRVSKQAQEAFASIPALLASAHPDTFFESPDAIWQAIGLLKGVHSSFDQLLDVIGLQSELSWWRKFLPFQGSLRKELLTAINLVNYNQDNAGVNGIVGLGSFAASSGGLFSITGGNQQIIKSAVKQATAKSNQQCQTPLVEEVSKRVTTVVGGLDGLALYDGTNELGIFDIVVLAAPLQHARIEFLVQSNFDSAILHPMPLGGLVNTEEQAIDHEGHRVMAQPVVESATRPYTQVVTTVVRNATINAEYFELPESSLPRSIVMTNAGKAALHGITAITQISSAGVYKIFSSDKLDASVLVQLFGPGNMVEFVKLWGGPHGGATPDYQGQGTATNFLLYDAAVGLKGHTFSGALYYTSAMEQSSLSCMELCAVGAKAVAKLVAQRVGLINSREEEVLRDEL